MSLVKKDKKKKSLTRFASRGGAGGDISTVWPQAVEKMPPCIDFGIFLHDKKS
jgi:hypothetical protein